MSEVHGEEERERSVLADVEKEKNPEILKF